MDLFGNAETIIVLDFETTGMYPDRGDRAIEVGAVKLVDNKIEERFQSLVYPGFLITKEIENITGITNLMLQDAPPADKVIEDFARFISSYPLVAHNASFDMKFLESELSLIGKKRPLNFGCTLQLARRIYPDVINYKLETLVKYKQITQKGPFHRALADAEVTAMLWTHLVADLKNQYGFEDVNFETMKKIAKVNKDDAAAELAQLAEESRTSQEGVTGSLF